jgi:hypothetical protein
MTHFAKFDPRTFLENRVDTPAKLAKAAKHPPSLASSAGLAGANPQTQAPALAGLATLAGWDMTQPEPAEPVPDASGASPASPAAVMPPTTPPANEFTPAPAQDRPAVARPKLSTAQMSSLVSTEAKLMVARAQLNPPPTEEELTAWAADASMIVAELGYYPRGNCAPGRWKEFLADARKFVEADWARRAYALDWSDLEMLGCDHASPWSRYDLQGLVLLINGGRVVALDGKAAVTEMQQSGALQVFRRTQLDRSRVVLITDIEPQSEDVAAAIVGGTRLTRPASAASEI